MSRHSLVEVRVDYMDRTVKDRNGKEILLKRVGYIDRSRYPGDTARRLRGLRGVGQVRRTGVNI
jgi:hypothetical protein